MGFLAVGTSGCARPSPAASTYEAVRDAYRRVLSAREKSGDTAVRAADDSAIHDLEARLRPIVGEFSAPFAGGHGRINLQTLLPGDMTSGLPDGILYQSADSATRVLVTTQRLLDSWIPWLFAKDSAVSRDPRVALADPAVLTQIFDVDAAVNRYADISVDSAPSLGVVSAMLVARAQDYCRCKPDEIIVTVMRGPRVFIIDTPARDTLSIPPPCLSAWDAGSTRQRSLVDSAFRATPRDTGLLNLSFKEEAATDSAFRSCYGNHVVHEPRFRKLVAQVRELVAGLPAR